ncbi:D-alanyl-D-alanine carboxypeptidase family protein [Intestinimonas sp. HCP28S3_D6]|uniref:D-alanyl-D-alanine carboxypeptidase family protein n=1 Tax=Intestinimonas sp. HCP28S3_D6 TaxID=3438942 RepID=UPI003F8C36EF
MKKYRRSLLSLLLALSLSLSLTTPWALASSPAPETETPAATETPETTPPGPVVEEKTPVESQLLNDMHIEAAAAILVNADTGTVLYEQNAHEQRYPASITKVMTTLLAIEAIDRGELSLDQVITVGDEVNREVGDGSSTQDIKPGEQLTLRDVLYCALIASANEACNVLAQVVSGSVDDFVDLMNQRAQELGMEDTHFANTHGYHNPDHYTTAYDISLMCMEAMKHETFRTIVTSKSYTVPATNLHEARELHETNALVSTWRITGYYYQYATGIKTGSTPEAGYCLASSATKDGVNLVAVVLGAENPKNEDGSTNRLQFSESSRLLDWGFNSFSTKTLLDSTYFAGTIPVNLSRETDRIGVQATGELEAILPNDLNPADFQLTPVYDSESLDAPVSKGQVVGHVTVSNGDTVYGQLDLVAVDDVSRSELLYRLDQIETFFSQLWVRVVLIVVAVLIVVLLLRWLLFGRRRRYGGSHRRAYHGSRYSGRRRRR